MARCETFRLPSTKWNLPGPCSRCRMRNRCQNGEDDSEPFLFHPSLEDIHRTSCHPPPFGFDAVFHGENCFGIFVAIPKTPVSHIQSTAPGPPAAMAVATPTMFPVPIVAANAVVNAPNWLTSP